MGKICFVCKNYRGRVTPVSSREIKDVDERIDEIAERSERLYGELIDDLGLAGPLEDTDSRVWYKGGAVVCLSCFNQALTRLVWDYPSKPFETLEEYEKKIGVYHMGGEGNYPKVVEIPSPEGMTEEDLRGLKVFFEEQQVGLGKGDEEKERVKKDIRGSWKSKRS